MITLMLCDDHKCFLEGLVELIKSNLDYKIIGIATKGESCIQQINDGLVPDILLLDISMPNGISGYEVAKYIQQNNLPIKVIALSMIDDLNAIKAMIRFGIMGFINKVDSLKSIDAIIHEIYYGDVCFPKEYNFTTIQIEEIKNTPIPWLEQMTDREKLTIDLISEDLLTKQVAHNMGISESVVNKKLSNIQIKTGTKSKSGIVYFFKKVGLLR